MDNQVEVIRKWLGAGSINIFGLPFSGKDTQGRKLAELFSGALIAGGDILRSYPDQDRIKSLMSTGELFPTDFYLSIILPYLSRSEFKNKPLILSSLGRWHGEEPSIIEAASSSGHPLKAVLLLKLTEDDVWDRLEEAKVLQDREGRADDRSETLKTRLAEFRDKTMPAIEFYREKGLLIEVDGTKPRPEVTTEIIERLAALTSA